MYKIKNRVITHAMINDYVKHLNSNEKSAATIEKYVQDVKKFMEYINQRQISKKLVVEYKEQLKNKYLATSINSMLAALNSFISFAGWQDCRVKPLRIQHRILCDKSIELTRSEYNKLITVSRQCGWKRINAIIQTIGGTGIRVSELKYITVETVKKGEATIYSKGKVRDIIINSKLQRLLLRYAKNLKISSGLIFITRNGNPVHRTNVWRRMKALCKAAGVLPSKVFPHNLRHLFAREFYKLGKDLARLADVLGHSNIETTRGYIMSSGDQHYRDIERMTLVMT